MEITSNKSLRSMKKRKTKSVKQIRVLNEQNTPVPIRLIQRYGLDGFNALINSPLLKTKFNNSIQDEQKALMTIKNFIEFLTTTDPNPIHYDIIRKVLQEKFPNLIHENSTIDEIARELISHCSILKAKLTTLNNEKNKRNNELFIWDQALLEIIHNTGNHGKTIASKGIKFRKKEYSNSLNNNEIDLSFWIKTQDTTTQYSHSSQAIQHLTEAIITDIIIKRTIWAEKNGPGTTNDVTTLITNLTVPGTVTTSKQADKVSLYKNTNSIKNEKLGYLDIGIPTFNSKVIESLIKTAQNDLESKTAVLLISFFIKEAYKQFKNRKNNEAWYDLKFPGRAKEIAARLNLNSNIDITRINNLIKFFDAFKCTMPSITSRLINVSECAHGSKFSPLGGWIVTVELPLRPLHIFNEKGSFIVPMLNNEPPFAGKREYHARQIILQWKIAEEFSNESLQLAKYGFIQITEEKWEEWRYYLGINHALYKKIRTAITSDIGYLQKINETFYTLQNEPLALQSLIEQGKRRQNGQRRGLISSSKVKRKKMLINNKKQA